MNTRPKPTYRCINPRVVPASTVWPNRTDTDGVSVLVCRMIHKDGEMYTEDTRTSLLLSVNVATGTYETLNSIYQHDREYPVQIPVETKESYDYS